MITIFKAHSQSKLHPMEESAGCGQPETAVQIFLDALKEVQADSRGDRDAQGKTELCDTRVRAIFLSQT